MSDGAIWLIWFVILMVGASANVFFADWAFKGKTTPRVIWTIACAFVWGVCGVQWLKGLLA